MNIGELRVFLNERFQEQLDKRVARMKQEDAMSDLNRRIMQNTIDWADDAVKSGDYDIFVADPQDFIDKHSLPLLPGTPFHQSFRKEYTMAYRDYFKKVLAFDDSLQHYDFKSTREIKTPQQLSSLPVSKLTDEIKNYITHLERVQKKKKPKAFKSINASLSLLSEYLGVVNPHFEVQV